MPNAKDFPKKNKRKDAKFFRKGCKGFATFAEKLCIFALKKVRKLKSV
jgi:hypothetical protein